ncbi:MAG: MCE family protein [Phycisphaerae bacterium]|nr:MCE family protein [Phycisphaerae bacterium]
MNDTKKHFMVGIFMLAALGAFAWMIFKFDDYSLRAAYMDSLEIEVYFDEAPGINENADVMFCGYRVGRVASVQRPTLLGRINDPAQKAYQILVNISIQGDQEIPLDVVPKVHQKGLGASYVELDCPDNPSSEMLASGAVLQGTMSQSSEFISENTQYKLDALIVSLTELSSSMQKQLEPRSPDEVDSMNQREANVTTTIMRLDRTLKNLNVYLEDEDNVDNINMILEEFAGLGKDSRQTLAQLTEKFEALSDSSSQLLQQTNKTISNLDKQVAVAVVEIETMARRVHLAADTLSATLGYFNEILVEVKQGNGTMSRLISDPGLYESLVDTAESLTLSFDELKLLLKQWREKGVDIDL